jgi:hypothetical protein
VRVLFDQGTPVPIRRYLPTHRVETAFEQGWSTLRNGELLSAAENAGFEVLLTTDANLRTRRTLRIALLLSSCSAKDDGLASSPKWLALRRPLTPLLPVITRRSKSHEIVQQSAASDRLGVG